MYVPEIYAEVVLLLLDFQYFPRNSEKTWD